MNLFIITILVYKGDKQKVNSGERKDTEDAVVFILLQLRISRDI